MIDDYIGDRLDSVVRQRLERGLVLVESAVAGNFIG